MALQYDENPLLFVTSTSSAVPNGRNVRSTTRTQLATAQSCGSKERIGKFGVIDFNLDRSCQAEDGRPARKRRKRSGTKQNRQVGSSTNGADVSQSPTIIRAPSSSPALLTLHVEPQARPLDQNASNTLVVATFHIRRIAAMALRQQPERLLEVLRFRQWSSVSIASEPHAREPYLNHALLCLASKLSQMTGGGESYCAVLASHTEAVHSLRVALVDRRWHGLQDLLTTMRLLAVFEMLDSLDNVLWSQHVAGAKSLLMSENAKPTIQKESTLPFSVIAPMLADALLNANVRFLKQYNCRRMFSRTAKSREDETLACLGDVAQLIIDSEDFDSSKETTPCRYGLLDKAHVLRTRLQTDLLKSDVYSPHAVSKLGSFDKLGLCLAGLVALDRLIASLRPVVPWDRHIDEERTSALSAQLLQLELKTADGDPDMDLMSAFQLAT